MSNESSGDTPKKGKQSFWSTLPGIITAITGLVVAITGLITALGENGILNRSQATPTAFPTATSVDADVTLPAPIQVTPHPTQVVASPPTCRNYSDYTGKANPNAILLAYTDKEFWVRYAELEEEVDKLSGVEVYIFDTSDGAGKCLRQWVKYLVVNHIHHWPVANSSKGRTYNEVWMNSPSPPIVGELASWAALPDKLLVTVVDGMSNPLYSRIFMCGEDVPDEILGQVAFWHAATSAEAFQGYLEQYESNGFEFRGTVACGG